MEPAPKPPHEAKRLAALYQYHVLDTPREEAFDRVVRLVSRILAAPMATVTLVDRDRQWFKASCGVESCETARDISFCGHVVYRGEPVLVRDALEDPRFHDNPLVTGPPYVRFYVGVPLQTAEGLPIGVLCAQDHVARPDGISDEELASLCDLAALTVTELELRKADLQIHQELMLARRVIERATDNATLGLPGVSYLHEPAGQLSGDVLLAAGRPVDGGYVFLIGDFTGHGLGAALGVPELAGQFYDAVASGMPCAELLAHLDARLERDLPAEMFLSAILIEVLPGQRLLQVWNAGMPTVLTCSEGRVLERIPSERLPLGIHPEASDRVEPARSRSFEPGERLLAFSDGVSEIDQASGGMLGVEGMESLIRQELDTSCFDRIRDYVLAARELTREVDDLTLLSLELERLGDEEGSTGVDASGLGFAG